MKYIIYILFLTGNLFSQNNTISDTLILSDSLYNANSSKYSFQKDVGGFGYNVNLGEVQDINQYLKIVNNQLRFRIKHGGGCGTVSARLVYNGVVHSDNLGNQYYILKLLFIDNDECAAMTHKDLVFDISSINGHKLKFYGFNQFIE